MDAQEPARRHAPERIGRYQIQERIGRGAMGIVYRARDEALGREVALKVLTADFEDDPEIRTRFHREAEAAARLTHPNIINILDVGEDGSRFFIVMELLRGAPLKEFLKHTETATLERKLDLMIQLCSGVSAAHNQQIFHRDIKPGNLFVRSDGILKVLDFGVARLASSSMTASGFIVGTPDYMSPEQACGTDVDARSDIFSIGGVFYYMLTGRKPFPATHLPTLFHQIQSEDPAALTDTPARLVGIVMKALAKRPEERYQSCQAIVADLEALRLPGALTEMPPAERREAPSKEPALTLTSLPANAARPNRPTPPPKSPAPVDTADTVAMPVEVFVKAVSSRAKASGSARVNTDDTVALGAQPSWWQDLRERGEELWAAARARIRRGVTPVPSSGNPDIRKRSL